MIIEAIPCFGFPQKVKQRALKLREIPDKSLKSRRASYPLRRQGLLTSKPNPRQSL
ncbi:MAG: DUF2065 domain-containing protein [Deltaproteobacteria bacterium]|nr:DUF2065 domain-containing protein [Deltaproteobacteria bacterium]